MDLEAKAEEAVSRAVSRGRGSKIPSINNFLSFCFVVWGVEPRVPLISDKHPGNTPDLLPFPVLSHPENITLALCLFPAAYMVPYDRQDIVS